MRIGVEAQGTRTPLSRERVIAAAVAVADAEGLAAVTMRRLGADLGVEAMSLYYHLPGKEALLDGLVAVVIDEIAAAVEPIASGSTGDDWRTRLRRQFLAARAVMLRHPWAPGLIGTRRTIPAGIYAYYEQILATLIGAGFSYRIAHRALHAFGSLPLGFAQEMFSPASAGGSLDVEIAEEELAAMAEHLPHLAAMVASEMHDPADPTLGWCDSQIEFEFTVDALLDGIECRRDESASGRRRKRAG